jgi:hypothetical protein
MFSNINKERITERAMQHLRQKGAATTYTAKF